MTTTPISLAPLQALVENALPGTTSGSFIGLIGDHPSGYSRSPHLWSAALSHLGIQAAYLPLDVVSERLPAVVSLLGRTEACLGANVTVPYKEAVVPLLDDVDPVAAAIGAVNTIVRTSGGRLIGTNTDGVGLIAALLHPGEDGPLLETPYGLTVLLIGGGGAARAAGVGLGSLLGPGELLVVNRSPDRAQEVAARATATGARATVVPEDGLDAMLPGIDLVINASVRGQAGIHRGPNGWTMVEPYSALAPASPAVLPPMPESEFAGAWASRSAADIEANHARSRARVRLLPRQAAVFDMIYAPPQTITLRHAREAGLRGANGRWMIIAQAVEACVGHVCGRWLGSAGIDLEAARREVTRVMAEAWSA
ncbi:MAG: shikimate dehydrogenase family protein [Armatimonadota bacterium]